jgi:Leucine-rich repeat (LRR) protein
VGMEKKENVEERKLDLAGRQLRLARRLIEQTDYSKLWELTLRHNYLRSIEPIVQQCASLAVLDLSINLITKIENVQGHQYLVQLILANNQIEVVEGLDELPELRVLVCLDQAKFRTSALTASRRWALSSSRSSKTSSSTAISSRDLKVYSCAIPRLGKSVSAPSARS